MDEKLQKLIKHLKVAKAMDQLVEATGCAPEGYSAF